MVSIITGSRCKETFVRYVEVNGLVCQVESAIIQVHNVFKAECEVASDYGQL